MKRAIWLTLLVVLVFTAIVIARLPASWVMPGPASGVTCSDIDGSIWSGTCSGLVVSRQPMGDLSWEVHPTRLLSGKLNASLLLTRATGNARADVEIGLDRNQIGRAHV